MPELRFPDPELIDEVVRLRPWRETDVNPAHRATQDPLIPRFTSVPERQSEADVRRFFDGLEPARKEGERLTLAIADARTDEFLGAISLLRFDWSARRGEIGYWLAPWARGRGATTRAVRLLSRWALTELGLGRLALHTDTGNVASQRVAERSGFTREGVLRSFEMREGRRYDLVVFSLLPDELPAD
jgi:RimJ/RimL family protein N-acetyltransferase